LSRPWPARPLQSRSDRHQRKRWNHQMQFPSRADNYSYNNPSSRYCGSHCCCQNECNRSDDTCTNNRGADFFSLGSTQLLAGQLSKPK
jgi:hypothetical protein